MAPLIRTRNATRTAESEDRRRPLSRTARCCGLNSDYSRFTRLRTLKPSARNSIFVSFEDQGIRKALKIEASKVTTRDRAPYCGPAFQRSPGVFRGTPSVLNHARIFSPAAAVVRRRCEDRRRHRPGPVRFRCRSFHARTDSKRRTALQRHNTVCLPSAEKKADGAFARLGSS